MLYALRHSGPSIDILNGSRDLASVKRRGCWAADASVRRYEKAAKTMAISRSYSGELKMYLLKCKKLLPAVMSHLELPIDVAGEVCRPTRRRA